ncbi:MAG: T9SS type A sorting domain-containing protein [Chitinophagales bacterium]|nr:T9SS type A sorting domain-containing protein [Chitinophagales bacterium]
MKTKLLIVCTLIICALTAKSQWDLYQYFDGADTLEYSTILVELDTSSFNIWQIGSPQKVIFDSAATFPNAIVTDTINNYPINNVSSFVCKFSTDEWTFGNGGIFAIQWKQKLDLDKKHDGGIVEYSIDNGTTWLNVFNTPYTYNFYGYDEANKDTLVSGEYAFSGTDSLWKDIWLCYEFSYMIDYDTFAIRYTLKSDTLENFKEGWLIDNMMTHLTLAHTIKNDEQTEYLYVYPSPTDGIVHIEAEKLQEYHIIESMELMNTTGEIVKRYGRSPTKFYIDISDQKNGLYYLKVNTNIKSETVPVLLFKN